MKKLVSIIILCCLGFLIFSYFFCPPSVKKTVEKRNKIFKTKGSMKLENFDELWSLGDPVAIEKRFIDLLPQAESLKNKSIYLQLLSQIALAQALQKKFDDAHAILNKAEKLLTPEYVIAQIRILLERGRVFQQSGIYQQPEKSLKQKNLFKKARDLFEQSYKLSVQHRFDYHTINAAHMIAIIAEKAEDKIKWNELAIEHVKKTKDQRAGDWIGALYNNLGQNYFETKQLQKALAMFESALKIREKEGHKSNIRIAKWAVARTLRVLNRLDEALDILINLLKDYEVISKSKKLDTPKEMFDLSLGLVYEELTLVYEEKTQFFSKLAYDVLSKDLMFSKVEAKRLERLKQIQKNNDVAN